MITAGGVNHCFDGRTVTKSQGNKSCLSHLLGLKKGEESEDMAVVKTKSEGMGQGSHSVLPILWELPEHREKREEVRQGRKIAIID